MSFHSKLSAYCDHDTFLGLVLLLFLQLLISIFSIKNNALFRVGDAGVQAVNVLWFVLFDQSEPLQTRQQLVFRHSFIDSGSVLSKTSVIFITR